MFEINLENKIAWITGASRGIGAAIAQKMADAGARVVVSYHQNKHKAEELVAGIQANGGQAMSVQLDVGDTKSCEQAYQIIVNQLGDIDVLVNNAGMVADNLFLMSHEEEWNHLYQVNVLGAVRLTKLVLPQMMAKRYGRIINISSVAGTKGGRGQAAYAATKGALEALSRSLASEVSKRNICVNCIAPGVVETDMSQEVIKLARNEILDRQLIKRFGQAHEVAGWVVFLASEYGSFVTGQTLFIDGGFRMI